MADNYETRYSSSVFHLAIGLAGVCKTSVMDMLGFWDPRSLQLEVFGEFRVFL